MSTYKRRIVYLSDEEWERLTHLAKSNKTTISATIRFMLFEPRWGEALTRDSSIAPVPGDPPPLAVVNRRAKLSKAEQGDLQDLMASSGDLTGKDAQAKRDELLSKINRTK